MTASVPLDEYIRARAAGRSIYMPYLTIGDPSYEATVDFAVAMIDAGADILELGIPFSDPTADGPVIQEAMVRSLAQGEFSMRRVFDTARRIHEARPAVPLVFLSYLNPILNGLDAARGRVDFSKAPADRLRYDVAATLAEFLGECRAAGIAGLVIPDLPFDAPESEVLRGMFEKSGVAQVLMVAPNTGAERLAAVCRAARGFIYLVTNFGVTGMRAALPPDLKERIRLVQRTSGVPVLAGFGFSEPEQARELAGLVDGVIVGSLNHRVIAERGAGARAALAQLTADFARACHAAPATD